ncbi:hypothetical protein DFP72DRAFT_1170673 [Ephemerocybe angulata]|uniref:BRCT domain-containing protein n=1 Tax=Ephemerocybe angulata TaxID=980116 RepID=A0A8H6HWQ1_9AGAR|nr:hypothetical protein DFP72DRAFT_1170673 [Tulosesus angulatus]
MRQLDRDGGSREQKTEVEVGEPDNVYKIERRAGIFPLVATGRANAYASHLRGEVRRPRSDQSGLAPTVAIEASLLSLPSRRAGALLVRGVSGFSSTLQDVATSFEVRREAHASTGRRAGRYQDEFPEEAPQCAGVHEDGTIWPNGTKPSFYSADPDMIFSGVMATATDLPAQDLEVLSAGILALGGQWRTGLTREITHLFTLSPTGPKYTTALHHQPSTNIAIVLPHWFDDAVRLGLGSLPTKPYEFPDPPVLRNPALQAPASPGTAKAEKEKKAIGETDEVKRSVYETAVRYSYLSTDAGPSSSNSNTVPGTTPARGAGSSSSPVKGPPSSELQVQPAPGAREVWGGRRILLARNLMLFGGRRDAVAVGIQRAGGVVVRWEGDDEEDEDSVVANTTTPNTTADASTTNAANTTGANTTTSAAARKRSRALLRTRHRLEAAAIPSCDIYITRYRSGPAYTSAFRAGKTIGTLAWLYHVQATGVVSRPMDQLLHYPVPERRVEGFGGHVFHSPPSSIIGPDAQQDHRSTARRGRRAYSTGYGQVRYGVLQQRERSERPPHLRVLPGLSWRYGRWRGTGARVWAWEVWDAATSRAGAQSATTRRDGVADNIHGPLNDEVPTKALREQRRAVAKAFDSEHGLADDVGIGRPSTLHRTAIMGARMVTGCNSWAGLVARAWAWGGEVVKDMKVVTDPPYFVILSLINLAPSLYFVTSGSGKTVLRHTEANAPPYFVTIVSSTKQPPKPKSRSPDSILDILCHFHQGKKVHCRTGSMHDCQIHPYFVIPKDLRRAIPPCLDHHLTGFISTATPFRKLGCGIARCGDEFVGNLPLRSRKPTTKLNPAMAKTHVHAKALLSTRASSRPLATKKYDAVISFSSYFDPRSWALRPELHLEASRHFPSRFQTRVSSLGDLYFRVIDYGLYNQLNPLARLISHATSPSSKFPRHQDLISVGMPHTRPLMRRQAPGRVSPLSGHIERHRSLKLTAFLWARPDARWNCAYVTSTPTFR